MSVAHNKAGLSKTVARIKSESANKPVADRRHLSNRSPTNGLKREPDSLPSQPPNCWNTILRRREGRYRQLRIR